MKKLASDITKTSMDTDIHQFQMAYIYIYTYKATHTHTHIYIDFFFFYYIISIKKFVVSFKISSEGFKEERKAEVR